MNRLLTSLPIRATFKSSGALMTRSTWFRMYAKKAYPAHTRIDMPALSPTMTTGNLGTWHKKIGDEVVAGDLLVEIETDKAQMDFECQEEGFLAKIFVEGGTKDVEVNKPIAILAEKKEDIEAFADFQLESSDSEAEVHDEPAAAEPKPTEDHKENKVEEVHEVKEEKSSDRIFASPIARKLAEESGIKLASIKGTGPSNRITKSDVETAIKSPSSSSSTAQQAKGSAPSKQSIAKSAPVASTNVPYTEIPLTNMRQIIAARLLESKTTIPHYYLTSEITMDKVLKLREVFNKQANGQYKISVNDFVIKASAMALRQIPEVNSGWGGTVIRQFNNVDISVAVSTPAGLITPIVTTADLRGLASISNAVKDLATRARDNKLAPTEFQGGSFTISNLGMYGVSEFSAIINPPQSCILAVGGTQKVLVPSAEGEASGFAVVSKMKVTLSCDHRVVDGAVGAQWLAKFKDYMENPLTLML